MLLARCVTSLIVLTLWPTTQVPPRDPVPRPAVRAEETGTIRGRITDRESGQPIARASVRLTPVGPPGTMQGVVTDGDGRYQFTGLAPGRYMLLTEPPDGTAAYLAHRFGQERPFDPRLGGTGTPVTLARGATFTADVALWRALAIEGRVVDDLGQPVANVPVGASPASMPEGTLSGMTRTSDDRGMFRVFGLAPGQYRLCADPQSGMAFARYGPRVPQPDRLLKTCYPAADGSDAQPITLTTTDIGGVEMRLRRGRVYTITGIALDSSGAPTVEQVSLVRGQGFGGSSSGIEVRQGAFIARDLPAGEYGIRAEIGALGAINDKRERELGYVRVTVGDANVENVIVQTAKAATVHGRLEFEGGRPASFGGVWVAARPARNTISYMTGSTEPTSVAADDTFVLTGLFGPQVVHAVRLPRPWVVKEIRYLETDILGRAVELQAGTDPSRLRIILTSRSATLKGRIEDTAGLDPANIRVLFYSADRPWEAETSGAGYSVPAGEDGMFTIAPVRAGDYYVAAMPIGDIGTIVMSEDVFARVAKVAERITLAEGEERSISVRVVRTEK